MLIEMSMEPKRMEAVSRSARETETGYGRRGKEERTKEQKISIKMYVKMRLNSFQIHIFP